MTALLLALGAAVVLLVTTPTLEPPAQIYTALPYVCALLVLAGFGRTRAAPAALTVPYDRATR